ncbi:hypothetical protein Clacol_003295 [Clathrus columnatus]|uniref:Uncharacterized protein n=1 Tax=Clathrus columnatus TaxID=1419009 RepID=A0AAV5A8V1_9AGAM|nr:hypothetical protein Clacol_003295 [Clathrus columnatus]
MPPKFSIPSFGNPPKIIPGESTPETPAGNNSATGQITSTTIPSDQKIPPPQPLQSPPSTLQKKPPPAPPQSGITSEFKDQIKGISSGFSSHQRTSSETETETKETTKSKFHSEVTETSSSETLVQSTKTTIVHADLRVAARSTKMADVRVRITGFQLSGSMLRAKFRSDIGGFEEQEINLDHYLGFENGILSWEATGFSTVLDAKVELRGHEIIAVYKNRTSQIDLYEKIRVFDGELTILTFSTRMYSQIPWMNFRILALPTMNYEIETMITKSTASIASSTVKTASIKLQREVSKLVETTMSSIHEEINRRVRLEVECLTESMQVTLKRELFATMQASLRGPFNWDTMREEFESGYITKATGFSKEEYTGYTEIQGGFRDDVKVFNGGNQSGKPEAHVAMA